jgi:transcriptional regulator with XRE-family HTH domain
MGTLKSMKAGDARAAGEAPDLPGPGTGSVLRELRKARGLSLSEVAAATGISRSLLSLIETERNDITVGRLRRLAELYGVTMAEILPDPPSADPIVVRRGERSAVTSSIEGIDLELLAHQEDHAMLPMVCAIAPGGAMQEFLSHEGEEFMLILEGRVLLELENHAPIVLETGDSAYYGSRTAHRVANAGPDAARMLVMSNPPAHTP